MGRRGIHNEGSRILLERLDGQGRDRHGDRAAAVHPDLRAALQGLTALTAHPALGALLLRLQRGALADGRGHHEEVLRHAASTCSRPGSRTSSTIDGFSVAVCAEIGVQLERHRTRSFQEMEEWGDRIDAYDLIVALSPAAMRQAQEYTRYHASTSNTGRSSTRPASARTARPSSPPTARRATRSRRASATASARRTRGWRSDRGPAAAAWTSVPSAQSRNRGSLGVDRCTIQTGGRMAEKTSTLLFQTRSRTSTSRTEHPESPAQDAARRRGAGAQAGLREAQGRRPKVTWSACGVFEIIGKRAQGTTCPRRRDPRRGRGDHVRVQGNAGPRRRPDSPRPRRCEHYEITRYGTLKRWAEVLGMADAAKLLDATLQEEAKTDEALTQLADASANRQAVAAE